MHTPTAIDLLTPRQTCEHLAIDEVALIDMVNGEQIAAYNIGGNIRFKMVDVVALLAALTLA